MRQDQYIRLQALSEKIAEVALFDADPDNWVGVGKPARELSKDERGDAYWCRKVAIGTIAVLTKVANLTAVLQQQTHEGAGPAQVEDDDGNLQQEIDAAESEAKKLLDEVARQAKKTEFHKRIHGKA